MKGSEFYFDSVQLMHYRSHKANFRRSVSYINFPDWIKKATINPKNKDDNAFNIRSWLH